MASIKIRPRLGFLYTGHLTLNDKLDFEKKQGRLNALKSLKTKYKRTRSVRSIGMYWSKKTPIEYEYSEMPDPSWRNIELREFLKFHNVAIHPCGDNSKANLLEMCDEFLEMLEAGKW